eukprot:TRINITY_DN3161_c0_g1_i3.p1 TRINITY_DN3161_c0_g1~~TRINITY_DN3161_c0_g1_i3.p1  ORF type:complete len:381 (-),score=125.94 TRINITY_DN3161_c0_g1_i3:86-1228(-)
MFKLVLLLGLLATCHAVDEAEYDMESVGIPFDTAMAQKLLLFSGLSYCGQDSLVPFQCPACPREYRLRLAQEGPSNDRTQVLVADNGNDEIIVAFRGTQKNLFQWLGNLDFLNVDFYPQACPGCQVHEGFYERWNEVIDVTLNAIQQAKQELPNANIYITGHSAGGTSAVLTAAYLALSQPQLKPTAVYTFGAPRVGNIEFKNTVLAALPDVFFRVIRSGDPIPYVPMKQKNIVKGLAQWFGQVTKLVKDTTGWDPNYVHFGTMAVCDDGPSSCIVSDHDPENPRTTVPTDVSEHSHYLSLDLGNFELGGSACGGQKKNIVEHVFGLDHGAIQNQVTDAVDTVKDVGHDVKDSFQDVASTVADTAKDTWTDVKDTLTGWW